MLTLLRDLSSFDGPCLPLVVWGVELEIMAAACSYYKADGAPDLAVWGPMVLPTREEGLISKVEWGPPSSLAFSPAFLELSAV